MFCRFSVNLQKTNVYVFKRNTPDLLHDNDGVNLAKFIESHKKEQPYLLNPYFDDPQKYYAWEVDKTLEEVKLVPAVGDEFTIKCVKVADGAFGLNRDELKKLRYEIYLQYSVHKFYENFPGAPQAIKEKSQLMIARMLKNGQPYSGMLHYFEALPFNELP